MKNIVTTVLVLLIIAALSYPSKWLYVPRHVGNWAHLFIFSVPMLWILRGYNFPKFDVLASFIFAAILSEYCQKWFCQGRGFELMDILLDCLGIVIGFCIHIAFNNKGGGTNDGGYICG